MYQYTEFDQQLVEQRSAEFRQQVERRLAGRLTEDEFKPLRLMNGLYLQLHAYMLRVAIPYGVLSATQLRALATIAERFDKGYGHFTTRQNIQFNWLSLVDTPDILDVLASVQMHAIQTSGNCIRNITSDPFAGVSADEAVDPRPICELLRQWSTLHPEFAYLPRKFKFAITGASNDRALIKAHDIGLQLRDENGQTVTDIWVGGGQGRTPKVAQLLYSGVSVEELMPHLDAILRVYNQYGRRDNKYKARIKILLAETGIEDFRATVDAELDSLDRAPFAHARATLNDIMQRFSAVRYPTGDANLPPADDNTGSPAFDHWQQVNVKPHKVDGHSIVVISLKPAGGIPGDATSAQMNAIADLAEHYSHGELRITHRQNIVFPHVQSQHLQQLWQALHALGLGESNIDLPTDIIACPGLDYCALATARSIPIAQSISGHIRANERNTGKDLNGVTINISGCINACAHHHVASIGVLGLDRNGTENYQITLGGRADGNIRIGERMGPGVSADEVPHVVERVINLYLDKRQPDESFEHVYDRIGKQSFKQAVYNEDAADAPA